MSDISFAREWLFVFLPLVPAALAAWWWGVRRAAVRAKSLSRGRATPPPYAAAILFSLAAVVAIVAAAQPRWGTRESKVPRNGADLVVVLDISRSMNARDVTPDRLQAAKTAVNAILNRLGGDRVGLVVFAGNARIRFPLTTDFSAARQVVNSLETGVVFVEGGTDAGLGLEQAVTLLSDDPNTGRVILLITDGDDLGGDPAASAQLVQQSGASLLIAGVGTADGATIPVADPSTGVVSTKLDKNGEPIVTRLNEPFLRTLASAAGGRYLGSDLTVVPGAVDGRLRALQSAQIDSRPTILPIERYRYFAIAALVLLVLASLAERVRFPVRSVVAFAALAILVGGCATNDFQANEEGRDALAKGQPDQAIEKFLEVQVSRPDDPDVALNLAAAYAAAGRNEEAILAARRALDSNRPETRARAYASIGHHQFAAGRLPESLDAFRRALLENGGDDASRHDYEVVLRLLFPGEPGSEPTPPADATPPPATGTPGPGSGPSQQPGGSPPPGEGTPGKGTPQPGGTPADPGGTPTTGQGTAESSSRQQLERQLREIDLRVDRLLEDAGESPSPAQALEILRLLAERSRIAGLRDSLDGGGGVKDY
jgi:Ca-activated chloride channel family protein